jgi:hypothetical protein
MSENINIPTDVGEGDASRKLPLDDMRADQIAAAAFASRVLRRQLDGCIIGIRVGSRLDVGITALCAAGNISLSFFCDQHPSLPSGIIAVTIERRRRP